MLFYPNSVQPTLLHEKYEFIEKIEYFSYIKNSFLIYANNKIFYNGKKIGKLKNALHKKFLVNLILANSNEIKIYNEIELRTYKVNFNIKDIAINLSNHENILVLSDMNELHFFNLTEPDRIKKIKLTFSVNKIYFFNNNIFTVEGRNLKILTENGEQIFEKEFSTEIKKLEFFDDNFAIIFEKEVFFNNFYFPIAGVKKIFQEKENFIFQYENNSISIFNNLMDEVFFYRSTNQLHFIRKYKITVQVEKITNGLTKENKFERNFKILSREVKREGRNFFNTLKFLCKKDNFILGNFEEKTVEAIEKTESAFFIENKNKSIPIENKISLEDPLIKMMNRYEYRKAFKYIIMNGSKENEIFYFLNYAHKFKLFDTLLEENEVAILLFDYIKKNIFKYELHLFYCRILKIMWKNKQYGYYSQINLIDLKNDWQILLIYQQKLANLIGIF